MTVPRFFPHDFKFRDLSMICRFFPGPRGHRVGSPPRMRLHNPRSPGASRATKRDGERRGGAVYLMILEWRDCVRRVRLLMSFSPPLRARVRGEGWGVGAGRGGWQASRLPGRAGRTITTINHEAILTGGKKDHAAGIVCLGFNAQTAQPRPLPDS